MSLHFDSRAIAVDKEPFPFHFLIPALDLLRVSGAYSFVFLCFPRVCIRLVLEVQYIQKARNIGASFPP